MAAQPTSAPISRLTALPPNCNIRVKKQTALFGSSAKFRTIGMKARGFRPAERERRAAY